MPAYFEEDRFGGLKRNTLSDIQTPGGVPPTHEIDPNSRAMVPRNPSRRQTAAVNAGDAVGLVLEGIRGYVSLSKNERIGDLRQDLSDKLPVGDYTLVITNPGDWGGQEQIEIYKAGSDPDILVSSGTDLRRVPVRGKNSDSTSNTVRYKTPDGQDREVAVQASPGPAPANRSSTQPNAVDREPRGLVMRGEPRQLPADARFDRGYPNRRDIGSIA